VDRASRSTFGRYSNYKAVTDRILDDLRAVLHAELFENPSAIGADRFYAERQLFGDFGNGLSRGDVRHDFILAVGERLVRQAREIFFHSQGQVFGQRWDSRIARRPGSCGWLSAIPRERFPSLGSLPRPP